MDKNENPNVAAAAEEIEELTEDNDAVMHVNANPSVHSGVPYLHVEVRINEYGYLAVETRHNDPIGDIAEKYGLAMFQISPPTKTTDRLKVWFCDPGDIE